jgi:hypothetical protein
MYVNKKENVCTATFHHGLLVLANFFTKNWRVAQYLKPLDMKKTARIL